MSPQIGPHNPRGLGLHVLPDNHHHRGGQAPGDHHAVQVTGLIFCRFISFYGFPLPLQNYKARAMFSLIVVQIKPMGAIMFLPVILVISSLLSAPVFVKSRLLSLDVIMVLEQITEFSFIENCFIIRRKP